MHRQLDRTTCDTNVEVEENNSIAIKGMGNIMSKQWFKNGNMSACFVNIYHEADFPVQASGKEQGGHLFRRMSL